MQVKCIYYKAVDISGMSSKNMNHTVRKYTDISPCFVDADSRRVSHPKWNVIQREFRFGISQKLRDLVGD